MLSGLQCHVSLAASQRYCSLDASTAFLSVLYKKGFYPVEW